ncbi:NEL-type E3 ubiquitin ligase domain-containing protein [Pseudomonas sp. NA-150]|uniref:NEL-type E3 ubiquitin ligase domain-containing protein n=1 Tax=Pseudomonas sp. NA-150 TaxID=3367525 RepID=UPI0037C606C3
MSDQTVQSPEPSLVSDEPFGDGHPNLEFLKDRLPAWYLKASPEMRKTLQLSQLYSQFSQRDLEPVRKRLMSVQAFAEPLLIHALDRRFNLRLDVQGNQFVTFRIENSHLTGSHTFVRKQSLLLAALQNFDESEMRPGRFLLGAALLPVNGLQQVEVDEDRYPDFPDAPAKRWKYVYNGRIAIKPEDFTALCRSLDLGSKYQAHLDSVFKPAAANGQTAAGAAQGVADKFMHCERNTFAVLTHIALMKKHISPSAHEMLVQWITPGSVPQWNGAPVRHCQLQMLTTPKLPQQGLIGDVLNTPALPGNALFRELVDSTAFPGSVLSGALLIEAAEGSGACLVYMPAEPEHPLKEYSSFTAFTDLLRRKLASKTYQQYFQRFVDLRISHFFFKKINDRLGLTSHSSGDTFNQQADLQLEKIVVATPPFKLLYGHLLRKTYGDSRVLAVPTGDEDQALRLARLLSYETHSLDLLNVAAFFIPVLGEVMAVVAISQLLQEGFTAFEEWNHGETDEALTHICDIAQNVALTAVLVSAVGAPARNAPAPSSFIEGLTPVTLNDGSTRLWKPELKPFEQKVRLPAGALADVEGRIAIDGKTWLPIEGKFYRVELDPALQKWRIKHPTDANYYSPVLERSAVGRWRHTSENPMAWEAETLFRRLHGSLGQVSQQSLERIMTVTGADEDVLRQIHVENQELPALLHDAVQHLQSAPVSAPTSSDPHVLLIQRDFPSLPTSVANEILQSANTVEKARMTTANRLPLRLAEQAREYQQLLRLNRANQGFYQAAANNPDTASAGLQLLQHLPGWPRDLALEVREASFSGTRLAVVGDTQQATIRQVLVKSVSGYQAFDPTGKALGQPDQGFFTALLQALPDASRRAVGLSSDSSEQALRMMLGDIAVSRRDVVARSLGMQPIKPGFKSPSRLEEGRVGYPLSGRMRGLFTRLGRRGSSFSPELAIKELFPSFNDIEAQAFLAELRAEYSAGSGGVEAYVRRRLEALKVEYDVLLGALDNWVAEGDGVHLPLFIQADKQIAASRIKNCWRRQSERRYLTSGEFIGYELDLSSLAIGQLPPLTAHFDHVGSLQLNGLGLRSSQVSASLQQFPKLYWLGLRGNGLTSIPEALGEQTQLVRLELQDNPLTLGELSVQRLQRLAQLRELNLNRCPLGSLLDLTPFNHLSRLCLRGTGIESVPTGLLECEALRHADLRDNRISELSDAVLQSVSNNARRIHLHDNPINRQSLARATQLLDGRTLTRMGLSPVRTRARSVVNNGSLWMEGVASDQFQTRLYQWGDLQVEPRSGDFFHVLDDLTQSADYRNNRLVLTRRVWSVIDEVSTSAALRDELFSMTEHPETCGDGAAILFNNMEVQVLVFKAMKGMQALNVAAQRDALFGLARGLDRLDELEKIAESEITRRLEANDQPDPAEVRLAYRVGLAQRLELPEQPQGMLFNQLSGVSNDMLDSAEQLIFARERTPAFLQSIIAREFWVTFLERRYVQRFESVQSPFHVQLEALDAESKNITDEAYLSRVKAIQSARESAIDALALELTQSIEADIRTTDSVR